MTKPFIHLIHTPYSGYVYDVNTDSIIPIEDSLYSLLENTNFSEMSKDTLEENRKKVGLLLEQGYLKSKRPSEIVDQRVDNLDYLLSHKLSQLVLQVTQNCNFRCSYCPYTTGNDIFNRSHSSSKMNWDTAKKSIDFFAERTRDTNVLNISFYGGEPFLEFDLIKQSVEYAEELLIGKSLSFNITTNATLLNHTILEFCEEHNISLMISIDGSKEINDKGRKFAKDGRGTFEKIIQSLENFYKEFPEYYKKIAFNCVIDPLNDISSIDSFFSNKLFKNAQLSVMTVDPPAGTYNILSSEFKKYEVISNLLGLLYFCNFIKFEELGPYSQNFVLYLKKVNKFFSTTSEIAEKLNHGGPCIPGVQKLFVSSNGKFFPCEKVSEASDILSIGNLDEGFNLANIIKILNLGSITSEYCKNCWALLHCNICVDKAHAINELSPDIILYNCRNTKLTVESNICDILAVDETKNTILKYMCK